MVPLGGFRLLAQGDDAAGSHRPAIRHTLQLARPQQSKPERTELVSQQRHWVGAQRETNGCIVVDDLLRLRFLLQFEEVFLAGNV